MDCDGSLYPKMEIWKEERDVFWEELKGSIDVYEDRVKVVIVRNMNASMNVELMGN